MAAQRYEAHVIPAAGKALAIGKMSTVLEKVIPLLDEHPAYEVRIRRRKDRNDHTPPSHSILLRHVDSMWIAETRDDPQFPSKDALKREDTHQLRMGLSSYGIDDREVVTSEVQTD